jgi:hypothetical protein
MKKPCAIFLLLLSLSACTNQYSKQNVWQKYDFLTPVPRGAGIAIPESQRVIPYNPQIYDNDNSYVIPYDYGVATDRDNIFGWNNMQN